MPHRLFVFTGVINAFTHSDTHNNANCTWQISAPTNKIVSFKFASFDLEAHGNCQYDYVNVSAHFKLLLQVELKTLHFAFAVFLIHVKKSEKD